MQTNEGKIIIDHVLENEENLEMALDIIDLTEKIRGRIIQSFLGKLKKVICERLDEKFDMSQWDLKTELCDEPYGKNSHSFGVSSKSGVLKRPVGILLKGSATLKSLYIGVFSSPTNELFNESMNHLKSQLDEKCGEGKEWEGKKEIWIWYQSLKKPSDNWDYTNWTNKDTLIKMHFDSEHAVKDIGNHLLQIIEVAKPEIEKWVQKNEQNEQNPPTP